MTKTPLEPWEPWVGALGAVGAVGALGAIGWEPWGGSPATLELRWCSWLQALFQTGVVKRVLVCVASIEHRASSIEHRASMLLTFVDARAIVARVFVPSCTAASPISMKDAEALVNESLRKRASYPHTHLFTDIRDAPLVKIHSARIMRSCMNEGELTIDEVAFFIQG